MAILNNTWFPAEVPPKPNGHYAHIVMLRVTESYDTRAVFQPVSVSHSSLPSVPVAFMRSRTVGRFQGGTGPPNRRSTSPPVSW
jgi:hypothetical protein